MKKVSVVNFTNLIRKNPDEIVPGSTESRDETVETDWFDIFRSGNYPQGNFSNSDVDEIAAEFALTGRRPPVTFDHLTPADLAPDAKPGSAAGSLVECRSVDSTDSRYPGTKVLQARAKVGWSAKYHTREGSYRNVSVGLYKCAAASDGKKRFAIHHLALLGAAPPGVNGLAEVIFSSQTRHGDDSVLSFSLEESESVVSTPRPRENPVKDPISFSEHEALLGAQKSELSLFHSQEVATFKSTIAGLESKVAKFTEELAESAAALETTKAESVIAVETARQEGKTAGVEEGKIEAERLFSEKSEKARIALFCADLRKSGKITEQELAPAGKPTLADTLFSLPTEARERFSELLSARPGVVAAPGAPTQFKGEVPVGDTVELEEAQAAEAQALVNDKKFPNFRAAISHVLSQKAK